MSLQKEHGPMLKPSSAEVTSKQVSSSEKVQASPNQLNVSVVEDDRRDLPGDNNSASPILAKELRTRNIVINQRFRKRKNTKGKQVNRLLHVTNDTYVMESLRKLKRFGMLLKSLLKGMNWIQTGQMNIVIKNISSFYYIWSRA